MLTRHIRRAVHLRCAGNSNVTEAIQRRVGRNLYLQPHHPLNLVKRRIEMFFADEYTPERADDVKFFDIVDDLSPVVTVAANFDHLLTPADHVSRSRNDTYYVDDEHVLRCHTSAHQRALLAEGRRAFLCTGDVYRCDTIDATHYPAFHQMEGVRLFNRDDSNGVDEEFVVRDLKRALGALATSLFATNVSQRWVDAYFPFTHPSFELELLRAGDDASNEDAWLELLGCGVIHHDVLRGADIDPSKTIGWAFGIGLERIAMALYEIPDIRLFWSEDERFLKQFAHASPTDRISFQPFSKYPAAPRDVSLWILDENAYHEHQLFELVREFAGDLAESVSLVDEFVAANGRRSRCFRIVYRSMERSLLRTEVDEIQNQIRKVFAERFKDVIQLR